MLQNIIYYIGQNIDFITELLKMTEGYKFEVILVGFYNFDQSYSEPLSSTKLITDKCLQQWSCSCMILFLSVTTALQLPG